MKTPLTWKHVKAHFRKCQKQNLHQVISTVDEKGLPQITPIGTVFLNDTMSGFYFEMYTKTLPQCAKTTKKISILGVNTGNFYWFKCLFKGKFYGPPAIKLYGELGRKRKATKNEMDRLNRRLGLGMKTKGYDVLWKDMTFIREFYIDSYKMVEFGPGMPVILS